MTCPSCNTETSSPVGKYLGTNRVFSNLSLAGCTSCNLVYAAPMPTNNELDAYYKNYWHGDVASSISSTRHYYLAQAITRIRYLKKNIDFSDVRKILDVGAGPGLFMQALKYEKLSAAYYAIEPDTVERNKLSKNKEVSATYASINDVPIEDKYDLIILSHVLEHVASPNAFIANLMKRLTLGGLMFVEVPNNDHLYKQHFEPHVLFFSAQSLNGLLAKHGKVIDLCSVGMKYSIPKQASGNPHGKVQQVLRELAKMFLIWINVITIEKIIQRNHIDAYGDDRQWLRALLKT